LLETSIVALAGTCRSAMPAWPVLFAMIELLITCCVIAEQIPLAPVCETVHEAGLKWLGSKSFPDGLALRVWRPEALAAAENRVTAAM